MKFPKELYIREYSFGGRKRNDHYYKMVLGDDFVYQVISHFWVNPNGICAKVNSKDIKGNMDILKIVIESGRYIDKHITRTSKRITKEEFEELIFLHSL